MAKMLFNYFAWTSPSEGGHTFNYNKSYTKKENQTGTIMNHDGTKDTTSEFIKQNSSVIENPHVMDFQTSDLL